MEHASGHRYQEYDESGTFIGLLTIITHLRAAPSHPDHDMMAMDQLHREVKAFRERAGDKVKAFTYEYKAA